MSINNKNLPAGITLVATFNGEKYKCETFESDGKIKFRFPDGRDFKSISAAAAAVTNKPTLSGWIFWSVDQEPIRLARRTLPIEPDRTVKKKRGMRTVKKKDYSNIEDEYLRGAEAMLRMTSAERDIIDDGGSDGEYPILCMECNKVFKNSVECSDHFIKAH